MVLHLTVLEQQAEAPEIFMPAIADWTADMGQQTITHVETGCRFHAFPVQREGIRCAVRGEADCRALSWHAGQKAIAIV